MMIWLALLGGATAAAAAFYGHYRELPGWMTGPEICQLDAGGCAILFRSPRAALLGVPNAGLGATRHESVPVAQARSQWERYTLADGMEVHIRRPLSRIEQRQFEKLLAAARKIFDEPEGQGQP